MADFNSSMIQSQSILTQTETVIELLAERPTAATLINPPKPPGQLCGYYMATLGYVELYIVEASGIRFRRIG
jgi:hypothetical protein